jgi:hypothetical protein
METGVDGFHIRTNAVTDLKVRIMSAKNKGDSRRKFVQGIQRFVNIKEDPGVIWVLNPKPTSPPVQTTGLAPRVKGGWASKTLVVVCNYNAHVSNNFGIALENRIKSTLSAGETVRLINTPSPAISTPPLWSFCRPASLLSPCVLLRRRNVVLHRRFLHGLRS